MTRQRAMCCSVLPLCHKYTDCVSSETGNALCPEHGGVNPPDATIDFRALELQHNAIDWADIEVRIMRPARTPEEQAQAERDAVRLVDLGDGDTVYAPMSDEERTRLERWYECVFDASVLPPLAAEEIARIKREGWKK